MIGVGLTDFATVGGGAPSLAHLFDAGEDGFLFDPAIASARFQDTAGLVPAQAGDPVALLRDQSGNGRDAVQTTMAARPVFQTAGTAKYFENDGVDDDGLVLAAGVDVRDVYCAVQYQSGTQTSFSNFHTFFTSAARTASTGRCMGSSGAADLHFNTFYTGVNGGALTGGDILPLPWGIIRVQAVDQSLFEVGAFFGANFGNISRQWAGRFAPLVAIDRILTPAEDVAIRSYFAARIGTPV